MQNTALATVLFLSLQLGAAENEFSLEHKRDTYLLPDALTLRQQVLDTFTNRVQFKFQNRSDAVLEVGFLLEEEMSLKSVGQRQADSYMSLVRSAGRETLRTWLIETNGLRKIFTDGAKEKLGKIIDTLADALSGEIERSNPGSLSDFNRNGLFLMDGYRIHRKPIIAFRMASLTDPSLVASYPIVNSFGENLFTVHGRYRLRELAYGTAEVGIRVPLMHAWAFGGGVQFYPQEYLTRHGVSEGSTVTSFFGVERFSKETITHIGLEYPTDNHPWRIIAAYQRRF